MRIPPRTPRVASAAPAVRLIIANSHMGRGHGITGLKRGILDRRQGSDECLALAPGDARPSCGAFAELARGEQRGVLSVKFRVIEAVYKNFQGRFQFEEQQLIAAKISKWNIKEMPGTRWLFSSYRSSFQFLRCPAEFGCCRAFAGHFRANNL